MKAFVPDYDLVTPKDFSEALSLLQKKEYTPFAGGTDLMVLFEAGVLPVGKYLNLRGLEDLGKIEVEKDTILLGALTTYTKIRENRILQEEFPMLRQAALETGSIAIQNRGTLGGNIVNASPAADSLPALLVYEAEIELVSAQGLRRVPYQNFHTGYKESIRRPTELLSKIRLPRVWAGCQQKYRKVGTRRAQAISKVSMAALARINGRHVVEKIRVAFGSVAPIPLRCINTENIVQGKRLTKSVIDSALGELADEIQPIDDRRSTREYRREVAKNLLRSFLEGL